MAAEASVALMHRITNVRLPGPLPGDGDQRYAIDLDEQGLICRIEAMGGRNKRSNKRLNKPMRTGTATGSAPGVWTCRSTAGWGWPSRN